MAISMVCICTYMYTCVCCAISYHRVRVVGLDNFKYEPVDNEVVYVEMGIYHGGHLLGSTCHTVEMAPTTYMRWNQWLVFDVQLKNLPKVWLCVWDLYHFVTI